MHFSCGEFLNFPPTFSLSIFGKLLYTKTRNVILRFIHKTQPDTYWRRVKCIIVGTDETINKNKKSFGAFVIISFIFIGGGNTQNNFIKLISE